MAKAKSIKSMEKKLISGLDPVILSRSDVIVELFNKIQEIIEVLNQDRN